MQLQPKPLPAAVLSWAPTQPVEIKLNGSRSECNLNRQAREIVLGTQTLPHGSYQLTAIVGSTELDLCIYSCPRHEHTLQKVLACTLRMTPMTCMTLFFVTQPSRPLRAMFVLQHVLWRFCNAMHNLNNIRHLALVAARSTA